MAALHDAGALDDPVRIETQPVMKVIVGDDSVGDVAAGADDAHAGETATARTRLRRSFVAHGSTDARALIEARRGCLPRHDIRPTTGAAFALNSQYIALFVLRPARRNRRRARLD